MIDPIGLLLTEIRGDTDVAAITTRIRGGEPAAGDAKGAGEYVPFVVLTRLGWARQGRLPAQEQRIVAKCYAATFQAAGVLAGAVSDAIHNRGPRLASSGIGIYGSFDETGLGATKDPDTAQPHEDFVIRLMAPTVKVLPIS